MIHEVAMTPSTTAALATARLNVRMRAPQRSLPPCGGGTGRGVDADGESAVPFRPRPCSRFRGCTTAYSQLLLLRDSDALASSVLAATRLPVPPPQGAHKGGGNAVALLVATLALSLLDCRSACSHRAAVTSTVPVAVRPKRSGRYMSST